MNRYIIFGLTVALLGAILALNNASKVDINLPLIGTVKTTVAHIFVGAGLVLLMALITLGIMEYFHRLAIIASHREEERKQKNEFEIKIEELEYQTERLERELSQLKRKTQLEVYDKGTPSDSQP